MPKLMREESDGETAEYISLTAYIAEIREWDNRSHLKRIKAYVYLLCIGMGIQKKDADQIAIASQLHDIGKSCTPVELLQRKGEYSTEEWTIMENHARDGEMILRETKNAVLQTGAIIAATHHERWDGSGYPRKLAGENIPLSGRICAVADVYDALTTPRPYKELMPEIEALRLIRDSSGLLFDPAVVRSFLDNYNAILSIKENSSF
jgi:putative two-component system response regulator